MRAESPEPFDARAYVDTGPVQERVYAQYAGLGWIGKNTCLINPELGSWLFLAEIICTLPLEPDTQGLEQCGTLHAVPRGVSDRRARRARRARFDALPLVPDDRARGPAFPRSIAPALGTHVYGCDICQEVCPYNQPPPRSADPRVAAAAGPRPAAPRRSLAAARRGAARARRRAAPMTRAKLTGLRRNLAVAIGNSGDADALAALDERRDDRPSAADPMVPSTSMGDARATSICIPDAMIESWPAPLRSCCSRCRRWPIRISRGRSCCSATTPTRAPSVSSSTGRWTSRRGRW